MRDAVGIEHSVEVGGVTVDPAGWVGTSVVIDINGDTPRQVVGAVVAASGLA